ncbi:MAG: histidine kinase [Flavobacteriales bacterium]|nr:histidine kinase [Flavobacteriales bacterium]
MKAPFLLRSLGPVLGLLLFTRVPAQQRLSAHIEQLPPVADEALHQQFVEILTQMDRFSAEGSMAAISKAFRNIDPERDVEANYYLHCFRAEVLYYEGLFHEGIADLDKAEVLAQQLGDSLLMSNVYNLKGLLHENIQEHHAALPLLQKAAAWFPQKPAARYPVSELHHIHGNMGSYLTGIGAYDSAGVHLIRSLDLATRADAPRAVAVAWWSLGNLALKQQQADSALRCYDRSVEVAHGMKDHDIGADALVGRAAALAAMNDRALMTEAVEQARRYLIDHAAGIGQVTQRNAHRRLARIWREQGAHEQALEHLSIWFRIDSAITKSNIRTALEMQAAKLQADADLALERVERARSQDALERVRYSRNVVVVASFLGAAIVIGLYLGYRSRQRAKQRLAELEVLRLQQERTIAELRIREEVGRDMHDDLGAGLSALKLRSEMALRKESDPERRQLWTFLSSTAGELMVNMRQMIWTLNADQSTVEDLLVYAGNYARSYLDAHELALELVMPNAVPPVDLSAQQRRNLLLVMKEALHNIVKHARATQVLIAISVVPEGISISIVDNGIGLPRHADKGEGNGLRNMARRLEVIGGSFRVEHPEQDEALAPRGTSLRIHMPFGVGANKGSIGGQHASSSPSHP